MEKLKEVKIMLLDGKNISIDEVMDIGQYYYLLNGKNIESIKKSDVADIKYKSKTKINDSSKYVKGDDGSCVTGNC